MDDVLEGCLAIIITVIAISSFIGVIIAVPFVVVLFSFPWLAVFVLAGVFLYFVINTK